MAKNTFEVKSLLGGSYSKKSKHTRRGNVLTDYNKCFGEKVGLRQSVTAVTVEECSLHRQILFIFFTNLLFNKAKYHKIQNTFFLTLNNK